MRRTRVLNKVTTRNNIEQDDGAAPSRLNSVLEILMIAALYFAASRLSLLLAVGDTNVTSVWPPSGISLAVILVRGYRVAGAVFPAAFLANILALHGLGLAPDYYVSASLATAAGNTLEGVFGAYLIRRFTGSSNPFNTIRDLFFFIVFGSLACTMVSSTIGVASLCLATGAWPSFGRLWLTWWLGDATGILIVSPIILMANRKDLKAVTFPYLVEAAIVFLVLALTSMVIFRFNYRLEYVIIPPLLWIALRFGRFFSALAALLVSGIALFFTINPADPSGGVIPQKTLLYLQTYIGVISIVILCLSVLMHERSEAEQSRLHTQKELYDIIDFLPDATFAVDTDGRVIAWNRAMEELSGISKNDMLRKGDHEYAIPFFGERRSILIDLVMGPADPAMLETYENIERRGGMMFAERYNPLINRYLSGAASALADSRGNVYGAIESIRDITDRKIAERDLRHYKDHLEEIVRERNEELVRVNEQLLRRMEDRDHAEAALAESEKKYRDLVESANSVIMRWKPDGVITFFNAYAQKFFGYADTEIIGRSVVGTIVPAQESSGRNLESLMEDIVRHPEQHAFNENENTRKNGEKVWIAWTNKPILDESGSLTEILSVGNDITERKRMEESLKKTLGELALAKERAEAADRIKSAFLATMSHELRTPLNSIIGFTGILLQSLAGPLNAEQTKQMGMVEESAQHLLSLINDVLDISKIEAGQLRVSAEPFDLREIIERAVDIVRLSAEKKGLALHVSVGPEVGTIVSDRRRTEQILLNLLSNAIKFTEQGAVTLTAAVIPAYRPRGPVQPAEAVPAARCSVTDTGIGILAEDLDSLFQPFHQIDSGLTRRNEGTGLGLAICRRLADLMSGEIIAESAWGKGSTFTFILPLKETRHGTDDTAH